MSPERPKVCAVVLNIGGISVAEQCLLSLAKADYPRLEVIFVHNGATRPGLEKAVREACCRVSEVVFTGENLGFAGGNNRGIVKAMSSGADYVLLLNDDAFVAPDFLSPLVDELEADRTAGMAGPRIFYASEPDRIWFSGAKLDRGECSFSFPGADLSAGDYGHDVPGGADYITGCAVLVSRELIETVGMLDEDFFLYWEDSDWGLRAAEKGFMSVVVPSSMAWHGISVSMGGDTSPVRIFHKTRSRLRFARRHCPGCFFRLLRRMIRDAGWLAFKSGPGGLKRAAALLAGSASYFSGGRGQGPGWLRE